MTASEHVYRVSRRFTDFDAQQEAIAAWDQHYFRMEPGNFEGGLDLLQVGPHMLFRERWSRQFRYQGTAPSGSYAIALPFSPTNRGVWAGDPVFTDTVIFQKPGQEADLLSPNALDLLVLSVPANDVDAICRALSGQEHFSDAAAGVVHLKPEAAARLRAFARDLLYPRAATTSAENDCAVERSYQDLLKQVLYELVVAQEKREDAHRPTRSAEIVRQATDLVLADPTNLIGLVDICSALGVSLRALQYAFRESTGMAAATWLRCIRLNCVHKVLVASSSDETKVKTVANEQGFLHLGHFSDQYRRLFGCLPSDTLKSA